jgi:PAS domain S-box-containing protein
MHIFLTCSFRTQENSQFELPVDLDDVFNDIYYLDLMGEMATESSSSPADPVASAAPPIPEGDRKRAASTAFSSNEPPPETTSADDDDGGTAPLTEQQKLERRERNREHAKRSRLRKKFLLESLQEQIHFLEEQLSGLKDAITTELAPAKAQQIIAAVCGDKEKYTPLPMPSGFGPVKTLMEPDFRLMSALSGSQQNFAISDPTLPDNPIVYCSQGFLDLTGYKLAEVLGRNCRFLQGPGTDQNAVEVIRKGIAEGVDTSVCLLNYKADSTPFWNQFFVAALRDAENNVVNYVGVQCEVSKAVVEKHMGEQKKYATAT